MKKVFILLIFIFLFVLLPIKFIYKFETNGTTIFFVIIMLLISWVMLIVRHKNDKGIMKEISELTKKLKKEKNISKQQFNDIKDEIKLKELKNIWNNFIDSFYETENKLIQTVDAEYFFNTETLLKDKINYKLLNYVPQALVGLGLLGTFWGLTKGLSGMNLTNEQTMKAGIETLINGAKTSFSTSLYGMYFSIVFSFFIHFYIDYYEKKIIKLKNILNQVFPKSNEDGKFEELKLKIEEIVTSNKDMAENIANRIEKSMLEINKGISSSFSSGFQESIGESLEKIFTSDFVEKFENIKNELIGVSNKNNEFINNYSNKIENINNNIENIENNYKNLSIEVSEKFNSLMDKIINTYTKMNDNYNDFMELTKEINKIQKENREYLGEFQHFSEKSFQITNSLDNFIDVEANIVEIWEEYKNSFSDLGDKLESNLNNYKNLLDKTSLEYQNIIREGVNDYTDKLKKGVYVLFKDYDDNLTKIIDEFNKTINHLSEKLSSSSSVLEKHTNILNKNEKQIGKLNILLTNKKD